MFCKNCGAANEEEARFCTSCGTSLIETPVETPVDTYAEPAPAAAAVEGVVDNPELKPPANGLAVAGMICGIVSLLCIAAPITGILGLVFGAIARSKGNKSGMATAGIACGAVGIGLFLCAILSCSCTACVGGLGGMM